MGYNLYIGEADVDIEWEDRHACFIVKTLDGVTQDAPLNSTGWGGGADRSNTISPSYTGWSSFCRRAGIADLVFRRDGDPNDDFETLLDQHPGCVALTEEHYKRFKQAQDSFKGGEIIDGVDWDKRRLNWLVFWARWALDNCKYPSFANS